MTTAGEPPARTMVLPYFRRWLAPKPQILNWDVVVYTRPGCHLCDAAWDQLQALRQRYAFHMTACNIDDDADLQARFGTCVPVVAINGAVRFKGRINPILLQRLVDHDKQDG